MSQFDNFRLNINLFKTPMHMKRIGSPFTNLTLQEFRTSPFEDVSIESVFNTDNSLLQIEDHIHYEVHQEKQQELIANPLQQIAHSLQNFDSYEVNQSFNQLQFHPIENINDVMSQQLNQAFETSNTIIDASNDNTNIDNLSEKSTNQQPLFEIGMNLNNKILKKVNAQKQNPGIKSSISNAKNKLYQDRGRPNDEILFFTRLLLHLKEHNESDDFVKDIIQVFEALVSSISGLEPIVRKNSKGQIMNLLKNYSYDNTINYFITKKLLHNNYKEMNNTSNFSFLLNSLQKPAFINNDEQLVGPTKKTYNLNQTKLSLSSSSSSSDTTSNIRKRKMKEEKDVMSMMNTFLRSQNEKENIMVTICLEIYNEFNVVLYPVPRDYSFSNTLLSCLSEKLNISESSIKTAILNYFNSRANDSNVDILKHPILSPERNKTPLSPSESAVRKSILQATIKEIEENKIFHASLPFIFSQLHFIFEGFVFILFNYNSNPTTNTSRINLRYPINLSVESIDYSSDNIIAIVEYDDNCRTLCCLEKDCELPEEL